MPTADPRFIPLVGYAVAWRFLNALSDGHADAAGLRFLCEAGALDRRGSSRDRSYMEAWNAIVDGRRPLSLVELYGALLQLLDALMAHGADGTLRALRAQLNETKGGLPADPELRGWWLRAAEDVERDLDAGRPFRGTNPVRLRGLATTGTPLLERMTRDEEMAMYRRMGEPIP